MQQCLFRVVVGASVRRRWEPVNNSGTWRGFGTKVKLMFGETHNLLEVKYTSMLWTDGIKVPHKCIYLHDHSIQIWFKNLQRNLDKTLSLTKWSESIILVLTILSQYV